MSQPSELPIDHLEQAEYLMRYAEATARGADPADPEGLAAITSASNAVSKASIHAFIDLAKSLRTIAHHLTEGSK